MVKDRIQISEPKPPNMLFSFYSKEHNILHQWFFGLIQNIQKACNDIQEVDLSHMHSMFLSIAMFQHSHKKLTANHDVYQPCLRAKEFSRETILVPSLGENFELSTVKSSLCAK